MNITTVGLDLAKSTFHLVGLDAQGHEKLKKRLSRGQVMRYFANMPRLRIPAMTDTPSGHAGHPRSAATQVVGLSIRLSAMNQGGALFSHRLTRREFNAMGIVDEPVEDGVTDPPATQILMPVADRQLRRHNARPDAVAFLERLEQILGLSLDKRAQSEVVDDDQR